MHLLSVPSALFAAPRRQILAIMKKNPKTQTTKKKQQNHLKNPNKKKKQNT